MSALNQPGVERAIVLDRLEKSFAGEFSPALLPLSMVIRPGGVTGLVGPDGAGKTTLMRILAGLLEPSGGRVSVAGLDPLTRKAGLRAILGYMPQRFGLYEDLTVQQNLDLYASLRAVEGQERQEAFRRLLRFTGLTSFTGRLAGKLSGGMKQKLGLACSLLGHPQVLLLDEPGVGVDPISRRELWGMVHELAGEGLLILWSTSYLDEAEQCREVLLLNQGRLLYSGEPRALSRSMEGRCFLLRSRAGNKRALPQKALSMPQVSDCVIQGDHLRLILRRDASGASGADTLEALGFSPGDMLPATPRFEDAFIDLLGGVPARRPVLANLMARPVSGDTAPVIEAVSLTKAFGNFTAADHVDFAVRRGEIFGLLGPNGAGKSTTFKMMCGLLRPSSGKALVLGMDLQKHPAGVRERIGYMAQKFSLYGGLSVMQNLIFFSGVYGLSGREQAARVDEMIETFGLKPLLGQQTELLPLGFKQRLALACALMHRPDILFLDEPTSGVDPLTRREFWMHINGMVEKGVTVMVTTHFMDEAEYCDRIGLVYQGRIIAAGPPDTLKERAGTTSRPCPGMEDAFIRLVEEYDEKSDAA
ncbi:MAG: ATP-binding cassette domain-containing protein [Desulfovibrionaceae bacterium]|nr:ATP-binding cassette domain-containing protein [Desulfovibrionaceae bacterium]